MQDEDQDGFEFIYEYLQKYLHDEELKNNFRFYYLYESGRMEFNEIKIGMIVQIRNYNNVFEVVEIIIKYLFKERINLWEK